jgi:membrane protease YdiL (CAAX protease family)
MYIEQGYKGEIGLWKYLVIPVAFIALMVWNFVLSLNMEQSTEELMQQFIDQFGTTVVLIVVLLPLAVLFFAVLGWTLLVHRQSIRSLTTARMKIDWKRIFFAFFLWGGVTVALTFMDVLMRPENYEWNFDPTKFLILVVVAVALIPLQTSFEEYLFRGYIMQGLGIATKSRAVPLVVTSVIFGLMHIANPEIGRLGYGLLVYYIGTGFFLGIITLMDEGLELALGFHAANNLFGALLVTAEWTAFQTDSLYIDTGEPELGVGILFPLLIIYPLLILLFARKYKWKNWKERLMGKVLSREEFIAAEHALLRGVKSPSETTQQE